MKRADALIHVEDPGAANYVAGLPGALAHCGVRSVLVAGGKARDQLAALGCDFEPVPAGGTAETLLDESGARLVIVGTAEDRDSLGLTLVAAARARGIASLGVIDGPSYPDQRFRGRGADPLGYAPDRVLVPDEGTRQCFMALGMAGDAVMTAGHPLFDRMRAECARLDGEGQAAVRGRVLPGAPHGRPVLMFLAEISDGYRPDLYRRHAGYRLTGRGGADTRTPIVIEEFLDASRALDAYRVLRLHPKNTRDEFAAYLDEFDTVSAGGAPHELIYAADLVAGMTTMLLVEATLLGRPTISNVPDPAEAVWLPTAACGLTPVIDRRADLAPALRAGLRSRPDAGLIDRALPAGAQERVVEIIAAMLGKGAPLSRRPEKERV